MIFEKDKKKINAFYLFLSKILAPKHQKVKNSPPSTLENLSSIPNFHLYSAVHIPICVRSVNNRKSQICDFEKKENSLEIGRTFLFPLLTDLICSSQTIWG